MPTAPDATSPTADLLDAMPDAVITVDEKFSILSVNAEARARFGPAALVGGDFWAVFPEAVELARDRHYHQAMADRTAARFEQPHAATGQWYVVRCRPIPDGMIVVLTDVSDVKRTDVAMEARGKRYRLIFELSPQPLLIYDTHKHDILMANDAAATLYRYTREEMVGINILELVVESDHEKLRTLFRNRTDTELTPPIAVRHVRRDGTEFDVEVTSHGFVADGQPIRVIQIVDVTDLLRIEKSRRQSEELYRTLSEAMPVLTWTMSASGRFEYCNQRFAAVIGNRADEIAATGMGRFVHADDLPGARKVWNECLGTRQSCEHQIRLMGGDGVYRWYIARLAPLMADDGSVARWLGVAADIDELRRTQTELRAAMENAEQANTRKDQFLAVLSHELRTPLTPALLTASSLKEDPDLPADVRDALVLICDQIELEAHLIDDLLDLTRITRGKFLLQPQPVDGRTIVDKAVDACRSIMDAAGLALSLDLRADAAGLLADPKRLLQVLNNLLGNAAKFTPAGGTVTVRTYNDRSGDLPSLLIEVQDTGVGIDPSLLPHIFNAFEQGEQSITRKYGGLGLGLTIGQAIASAHGGTLSATSGGPGRGTTMLLRLPLKAVTVTVAGRPLSKTAAEPGVSILLVEDNLPTLRMLAALLTKLGHVVRAVASPPDAIEAVQNFKPDLLVSDIGMPGQSGWSLLKQLRTIVGPDLPAIAVSGYGTDEDLKQSKAAGFADHLVKPIDADRLRSAIEDLLRKSRA